VAGVGAGLSFVLNVGIVPGAVTSASFQAGFLSSVAFAPATAVSYGAPTIASIVGSSLMPTLGGSVFAFTGQNYGPLGVPVGTVSAKYGKDLAGGTQPVFVALGCVVTVAHTQVNCTAAPGVGANFNVQRACGDATALPSGTR
jgi:hypothetical protein